MRAIVFDRCGDPAEVLSLRDLPNPVPGPGEVRVRMLASPVNPSDLLYVRGRYATRPSPPTTPGFEGVGVVEATGGGFLGWLRRGKRCVVLNDRGGLWAEQCVVPARQLFPVPESWPAVRAATFFVNPATALVMTRRVLKVRPGAWLLQSAAGSALGRMVIRLAKLDGYRTLNLVRRPEQIDELKRLGADEVLLDTDPATRERIQSITGGGVQYALDPVGGATGTLVVEGLAPGGLALLYGLLSGEPVALDPRRLLTGSKRVHGFWLTDWVKGQSPLTVLGLVRQVRRLVESGVLATEVGETFPLSQIREAVVEAERPGRVGKVVLELSGDPGRSDA